MARYKVRDIPFALDFNPETNGEDVTIENSASEVWNGTDDLTIFLRFKPHNRPSTTSYLFSIPATAGDNRKYIRQDSDGDINVAVDTLTLTAIGPTTVVGEWQSVAIVTDAANSRWRAYYNGSLVKDWTAYTPGTGTADITIGNNSSTTDFASVAIQSEVRLWNRVLTEDEVAAVEFENNIPQDNLSGEWLLDEGSGTTAVDSSGNDNDGVIDGATYTDDTQFKSRDAATNRFALRDMGTSLRFDGTGEVLMDSLMTAPNQFTVATWFKKTRDGSAEFLTGNETGDTSKIGFFGGNFFIRIIDGGSSDSSISEPTDRDWHFLVVTRDADDVVRLSLDGAAQQTLFSGSAQTGDWTVRRLARSETGQRFIGNMDEFRIWALALSDSQIADMYYRNIVPTTGLFLEYLLDEGSGTTATDTSSTSNDGTISGATYVDSYISPRTAVASRSSL